MIERLRNLIRSATSDDELERLDRRAFLLGMTATAGGLLVPRRTIITPPRHDPFGPLTRLGDIDAPNGFQYFEVSIDIVQKPLSLRYLTVDLESHIVEEVNRLGDIWHRADASDVLVEDVSRALSRAVADGHMVLPRYDPSP